MQPTIGKHPVQEEQSKEQQQSPPLHIKEETCDSCEQWVQL